MPIILPRDSYDAWLNPDINDSLQLQEYLAPYPAELMQAYPVSTRVNSPRDNDGELLTRL